MSAHETAGFDRSRGDPGKHPAGVHPVPGQPHHFGGTVPDIRYILYIDPESYARQAPFEIKQEMGRLVGEINRHPDIVRQGLMMMGPGRWGSSNLTLGVNTSYADINNTSVLVEIAREEAGHLPDVSYGTHFFLDLVESQIIYLPLYPDDPQAAFNQEFFRKSPNSLSVLLPEAKKFEEFIKVIDVPAVTGGKYAYVVADPRKQQALCFTTTEEQVFLMALPRYPAYFCQPQKYTIRINVSQGNPLR
jgi:pyruvate, water dikinase